MSEKSLAAAPHAYVPEPLFLPRGSIRAAVGIATGVSCWVMVFAGIAVPGALLSLILAVLGYYFGFRTKDEPKADPAAGTDTPADSETPAAEEHSPQSPPDTAVHAAPAPVGPTPAAIRQPLFLPTGVVRLLLSLGFLATGAFLWMSQRLDHAFLEFFVVLSGLILGYLFSRVFGEGRRGRLWQVIHHAKGALVLAITACLCCLLLLGPRTGPMQVAITLLCAAVSFYFGSRT